MRSPRLKVLAGGLTLLLCIPAAAASQASEADSAPVPVVLVPGWGDLATGVAPLRDRLFAAGWAEEEVLALSFEDPRGSNEHHAREVERAVHALRERTGHDRVDIVAHSMGGLAVREFLGGRGGAAVVRRTVFLGTPHRGTLAALLAWGDGGREMAPGSDFLVRLNRRGPPEGVEMLSIRSPVDVRVIPGSSGMLPGAYNAEICCPSHVGMVDDDETFREVQRFLRRGHEQLTTPDESIPLRADPTWPSTPPGVP